MKKIILKFFTGWLVNIIAIYLASYFLIDFNYDNWQILVISALAFGVIAMIVRPLLKVLSLPFTILAPVVFFVAYAFILYGIGRYVPGFHTGSMTTVLEAGGIVAVTNFILHLIIR